MHRFVVFLALSLGMLLPNVGAAQEAEPFRYRAGKHGNGELKFVDTIPVLVLRGTPEEIGEQTGVLAVRQAKSLFQYPRDYFRYETTNDMRRQFPKFTPEELKSAVSVAERTLWPKVQKKATTVLSNAPAAHRAELDALIKHGNVDGPLLTAANGMFDLGHVTAAQFLFGCSSLIVPPQQSATKGLLFGRNLDFYHFGYLHHYSMVLVYRSSDPKKHAFASAGFPGFVGCFTGMNDAGLTIASHEVQDPNTTTRFNPKGVPFAAAYRRILEECTTIGEAIKLLDSMERASVTSLVIADTEGGAVIEVTPDTLAIRRFKEKTGVCTNHFCVTKTPDLKEEFATFQRFDILTKAVATQKAGGFGIDVVQQGLHDARLFDKEKNDMTIQTFVFEPTKRVVHLSFGAGKVPATAGKHTTLDLKELWGK
jgi:hypothetical protein